ncbi:hypothetical protein J1605_006244 [Eschrichtius robustus]|uniref:Uncharacterized protein n=1 Tax=Eschrichtius robustus TaxID=9764 RepID=A0AB34H4X2_ESCRO|nr:hypothetical protein J1605_006244 [Eschrichtius robustus]
MASRRPRTIPAHEQDPVRGYQAEGARPAAPACPALRPPARSEEHISRESLHLSRHFPPAPLRASTSHPLPPRSSPHHLTFALDSLARWERGGALCWARARRGRKLRPALLRPAPPGLAGKASAGDMS